MTGRPRFPPAPAPLRAFLRLAPPAAIAAPVERIARATAETRPELFERLGPYAERVFLIDPTDLPVVFLLRPGPGAPQVAVKRRGRPMRWDVRIAGALSALIALVHGAEDGDALFFSRDIVMEGDTEAAVALRNAIDAAEIDLLSLAAGSFGTPGRLAGLALRPAAAGLARLTGVALLRSQP